MKISENGLRFIQQWEGLKLKAYPDPATGGIPWTIGYGHTKGVKKGDVITEQQAEDFLHDDLTFAYATLE
ncbi:lysozyme [Xenorhabdus hominickii]|uniref:Lysozyme n=1 Tax=Xenorhabdus hominickii TaxID=351679 RepID=A0A2G0QGQ9_XENHO|nr:lysozyme [Xenorhabdus hominickii]